MPKARVADFMTTHTNTKTPAYSVDRLLPTVSNDRQPAGERPAKHMHNEPQSFLLHALAQKLSSHDLGGISYLRPAGT